MNKKLRIAPPPGTTYVGTLSVLARFFKSPQKMTHQVRHDEGIVQCNSFRQSEAFVEESRLCQILPQDDDNILFFSQRKCFAFTLAEVLITLAIIGIVAAMTLPVLIQNYQKKQTVTTLRQAYTLLNQANELSKIDNGQSETWNFTTSASIFMDTYLTPYFKNAKIYKSSSPYPQYPTWADGMKKGWILGTAYIGYYIQTPQNYIYFVQRFGGTNHMIIYIDINGIKGPNRVGRDIFLAEYSGDDKHKIQMHGLVYNNSYQHCNKKSCNSSACGKKIERDGWQIKADYPWF